MKKENADPENPKKRRAGPRQNSNITGNTSRRAGKKSERCRLRLLKPFLAKLDGREHRPGERQKLRSSPGEPRRRSSQGEPQRRAKEQPRRGQESQGEPRSSQGAAKESPGEAKEQPKEKGDSRRAEEQPRSSLAALRAWGSFGEPLETSGLPLGSRAGL